MEHDDYLVWHGWQQMLSSSTLSINQQRGLLEGMLLQQHGVMSFQELNQLTDRILQMNKQLGAGDDGRVSEVMESTTTTTTATTSTIITQQQRYDTANEFLQLLTTSGGMGFSLEQAQQKADEIRQGRQDTFVRTHLESKAAKQNASQQTVQARPSYHMQAPNYELSQQQLQQQQLQQAPQQLCMQVPQQAPHPQSQQQQDVPSPNHPMVQQPAQTYPGETQQQGAQQARPLLHHERYR